MAEYALIRGGRVANVIVADAAFAARVAGDWAAVVDVSALTPRPGPGWAHDGTSFTAPAQPEPSTDPAEARLAAARAKWNGAPALVKNEALQALAIALGLQDP